MLFSSFSLGDGLMYIYCIELDGVPFEVECSGDLNELDLEKVRVSGSKADIMEFLADTVADSILDKIMKESQRQLDQAQIEVYEDSL